MADEYGIVANVVSDRVLRTGAKVWISYCNGDAACPMVMGLNKFGRWVHKYTHFKRLTNFRAAWVPEHLRATRDRGRIRYRSVAWLYSKEEAARRAAKLADAWTGVRFFNRDGTAIVRDGITQGEAQRRTMEEATTPVPTDHPLMKAWEAFKATPAFGNAKQWAAHPEHLLGSLWASFEAGWQGREARPNEPHANSLYVSGYDAKGELAIAFASSSSEPGYEGSIMTSFLELERATRLRGVRFVEHKVGAVLVRSEPAKGGDEANFDAMVSVRLRTPREAGDGYAVEFDVGVQRFTIGRELMTQEECQHFADMFKRALATAMNSAAPEGCTVADAKVLRRANHSLAEESAERAGILRDVRAQLREDLSGLQEAHAHRAAKDGDGDSAVSTLSTAILEQQALIARIDHALGEAGSAVANPVKLTPCRACKQITKTVAWVCSGSPDCTGCK